MKKLLIIIWVLCGIQSYAQEKIERKAFEKANLNFKGYYITDARLDKFVGTWQWQENGKTFTLLLEKIEEYHTKPIFKFDMIVDMIQGKYHYSENGHIANITWNDFLFINLGLTKSENELGFVVRDESDQFLYGGSFIIDKENGDMATLKFYQQEKHFIDWPGKPPVEKEEGVEIPGGVKSLEGKVLTRVTN
jgi:hypothetical protein